MSKTELHKLHEPITVSELVTALQLFPDNARVTTDHYTDPLRLYHSKVVGSGFVSLDSGVSPPLMGGFESWAVENFTTPGDKLLKWLREHPRSARDIAFAAISGLYLDADEETILYEDDTYYPRGSGSNYVDHVGYALHEAGVLPLIESLQKQAREVAVDNE